MPNIARIQLSSKMGAMQFSQLKSANGTVQTMPGVD